ncbi:MAG: hypothetical protein CVU12_01910 [Bacteroidetes bacterium HGW-Bacteroidetes-7]|jgi:hypothetical protein|nr:MAG: hypothetical protein CVU12_01910 [Bacteroidetes bacterium HGW-Bacteroidetes-7]
MDTIHNKFFFVAFALIGLLALVGALFLGASHQYYTAALCGIACLGLYNEIRKESSSKRSKNNI